MESFVAPLAICLLIMSIAFIHVATEDRERNDGTNASRLVFDIEEKGGIKEGLISAEIYIEGVLIFSDKDENVYVNKNDQGIFTMLKYIYILEIDESRMGYAYKYIIETKRGDVYTNTAYVDNDDLKKEYTYIDVSV